MLTCCVCGEQFDISDERAERIASTLDFSGHECPACVEDASWAMLQSYSEEEQRMEDEAWEAYYAGL